PTVVQLMVPLLTEGQALRLNVFHMLPLIPGAQADGIGHGRVKRQFVPATDTLTQLRQLGVRPSLVSHGVDIVLAPVTPETRPHIGREPDTRRDRPGRSWGQTDIHWNNTILCLGR